MNKTDEIWHAGKETADPTFIFTIASNGISASRVGISALIPQIEGQVTIHAAYDILDRRREGTAAAAAAVEAKCSSTGDRCSALSQRPERIRSLVATVIVKAE